jgi:hypothetical protein
MERVNFENQENDNLFAWLSKAIMRMKFILDSCDMISSFKK